jgi:transcriptional regulator of arginine metabolism
LVGGSSPVRIRQTRDAACLAAIAAAAPMTPYTAVHNNLRNTTVTLPVLSGPRNLHAYLCVSMQRPRELDKTARQKLIASVIARKRIGTQYELLEALARAGCRVTQATASRDIRELGLEKTHDVLGRPRYVAPQDSRRGEPRDALTGVLAQFGRSASAAQNIVVVQSELGSAPAIARALDRLGHPRIVGTIAGDDTCLVVARDTSDAAALAEELADSIGG